MGSKLIFLLGLIVGGLLIFFCINKDKRGVLLEYKNRYFNTAKVAEVATVTDIRDTSKGRINACFDRYRGDIPRE